MKKKLISILAIILAASMLFSGCASNGGTSASPTPDAGTPSLTEASTPVESPVIPAETETPAPEVSSVTVVDQVGREVVIEGDVNKIISCYYISSSTCIALGLADKMIAIEAKAASRPIYALAAPELLDIPDVGSAKEFNMEACIAMEPDLVILPKRLQDSADTMAELGIKVILVSPESHDELVEMIRLIAEATGTQDTAEALVTYYNDQIAEANALTEALTDKPTVYMGGNGAYLSTAPKDMYQAKLIDAAGGINAAGDLEGNNWVEISYEQILAMNPDVIIIPAEASYSRDDILADPQLAAIAAVENDKVFEMPKGFEAWDSPVPSCTLGIKWMLNVLHEDLYSTDELVEDVTGFYQEFYNVDTIDTSLISK